MNTFLNKKSVGEKGHIQNNWSIVYCNLKKELYFQIVRSDNYIFLESKWFEFLCIIYNTTRFTNIHFQKSDIFKIIKSTRSIKNGKGEQKLSFILLFILWNFDKNLSLDIFKSFIINTDCEEACGSMKDIKYFCEYIYKKTLNKNHELINYIIDISRKICKKDEENYEKNIENNNARLTLFGKWFPRNKSKRFGWINKKFAKVYYKNLPSMKGQKKLRKLLVKFNNYLDTVEIKLSNCSRSLINFDTVSNGALLKYRKAFLKLNNSKKVTYLDCCRDNFCNFIDKKMLKRDYRNIYHYKLVNCLQNDYFDYKFIQQLWLIKMCDMYRKKHKEFLNKKAIIFCDTALSFYNNQIMTDNAMAISVLLSEISHENYKNRVISFNTDAKWINFDNCISINDKINMLKSHSKIGYSNIYDAIEMFLQELVSNNVKKETVDELTLYFVSDFQVDINYNALNFSTLYENIMILFHEAGLRTCWKVPYNVSNIVFWNLKSTDGFPCKTYYKNCVMKSGFNFT